MAAAYGASSCFLSAFYANSNRWRKNSGSLRKMYGIGQDDGLKDSEIILADLEKQFAQNPMPASQRNCPECSEKMSLVYVGEIEIDCCMSCSGVWFDPGELKDLTGEDKDVPSDNLKFRPSKYTCPDCSTRMNEFVFKQPSNLLVDRCPFGHGVYLEKGELERAIDTVN